jgi:hypothetical protein
LEAELHEGRLQVLQQRVQHGLHLGLDTTLKVRPQLVHAPVQPPVRTHALADTLTEWEIWRSAVRHARLRLPPRHAPALQRRSFPIRIFLERGEVLVGRPTALCRTRGMSPS